VAKRFSVLHRWFPVDEGQSIWAGDFTGILDGNSLRIDWATMDFDDEEHHLVRLKKVKGNLFRGNLVEARTGRNMGAAEGRLYESEKGLLVYGKWLQDGDEEFWVAEMTPEKKTGKK